MPSPVLWRPPPTVYRLPSTAYRPLPMCSELFRIPLQWHGVPIFGFGVLLAAWLALSAWGWRAMARQLGWQAAAKAHLPTILIVAAAIALFIPRYFPSGVPIRGYGVMVLAGSVAGILIAVHRAGRAGVPPDEIMGLTVAMFLAGIVGARLFYVVEYWEERIHKADWQATLKAALSFTEGGLVIYGAFLGAMAAFFWYMRRRRLPALAMADLIAPSMLVGLAFGRVGCLLNGCCYGGETALPWAVTFPHYSGPEHTSPPYADQAASGRFYGFRLSASGGDAAPVIDQVFAGSAADEAGLRAGDQITKINEYSLGSTAAAQELLLAAVEGQHPLQIRTARGTEHALPAIDAPSRSRPVHPTQLYESITAALLAWVLWAFYPFRRRDGAVTALMITLYPIARFLLEAIRIDEPAVFGTGLSISQNISVLLLAVAAGLWLYIRRRGGDSLALPLKPTPPPGEPSSGQVR